MTDLRDLIAETLAGHVDMLKRVRGGHLSTCSCGTWSMPTTVESLGVSGAEWRLHRADVLLAALGDRVLPEGGEMREEWLPADLSFERVFPYRSMEGARRSHPGQPLHHRKVIRWPDGSICTFGPRPVDTEETP